MGLLRIAVPLVLLAVFLYRARTARVFLLGIPFLIYMGSSVFFERVRIFYVPGRIDVYALQTIWLVVVWAFATGRILPDRFAPPMPRVGTRPGPRLLIEEYALLAIGAIALGHIVVESMATGDFAASLSRGFGVVSMVVGYFLVRDVAGRARRTDVVSFLATVVVANAVATTLFVLHQGLHLGIYEGAEHSTTVFRGQTITRSFWFAPRFVVMTLAFVFARPRWSALWSVVGVLALLGILISYTRSLVLVIPVTLLLALALRELKKPDARRVVRRLLGVAVVAVLAVWAFATFLPAEASYFEQRFVTTGTDSSMLQDQNLMFRTDGLRWALDVVQRHDVAFGVGFPLPADEPTVTKAEALGADTMWILVVYRLGLVGVIAFVVMVAGFGLRAFRLFMGQSGDGEYLGLVFLVALVGSLMLTSVSPVFMDPSVLPMGLWLFAFVSAEAHRAERDETPVPADQVTATA
jgi:hypothetical protein